MRQSTFAYSALSMLAQAMRFGELLTATSFGPNRKRTTTDKHEFSIKWDNTRGDLRTDGRAPTRRRRQMRGGADA